MAFFEQALLPFQFSFMQHAFLMAALISIPAAMLSCFLVLKGWALMGDAVSHAILPGVIVAYLLNIPLLIGAFCAGMGCSLVSSYLSKHSRVKPDTVMGVVFSGMFALGIVLFAAFPSDAHLDHILFGNILGVTGDDLYVSGGISFVIGAVLLVKWRDILLFVFDDTQARAVGLNVPLLQYGLMAMLSLSIIATLTSVGLILAVALLITPGAIAFLWVRRFGVMLAISSVVCLFSMFFGVYVSFFLDSAPAPTIVMVMSVIFIGSLTYKQVQLKRMKRQIHALRV